MAKFSLELERKADEAFDKLWCDQTGIPTWGRNAAKYFFDLGRKYEREFEATMAGRVVPPAGDSNHMIELEKKAVWTCIVANGLSDREAEVVMGLVHAMVQQTNALRSLTTLAASGMGVTMPYGTLVGHAANILSTLVDVVEEDVGANESNRSDLAES